MFEIKVMVVKNNLCCASLKGILMMVVHQSFKALLHGAIFLATCIASGRCKIGKYMFSSQFANIFLTYQILVANLHVPRVELSCKLREKMYRVTEPLLENMK